MKNVMKIIIGILKRLQQLPKSHFLFTAGSEFMPNHVGILKVKLEAQNKQFAASTDR